ncbi:MAG: hypothetical protein WBO37_15750 [Gammaproteobacteria bacterium]
MLKNSLIILLMAITAGLAVPGRAGDSLLPEIPAAQARFSEAQGCVEPTGDMRKNHMKYILHERDETVHEGIRGSRHSLKECINCHVSDAPDAPRVSSEEHFCSSCHSYAAVHIDCFQCHADRPAKPGQRQTVSAGSADQPRIMASEGIAHE